MQTSAVASFPQTVRLSKVASRSSNARAAAALVPRRRGALRVAAALPEDESGSKPNVPSTGREPFSTSPLTPAFTRRREHVVGRLAALGFGFSLVGELLTGIGPITQLHYETGLSQSFLYILLLGLAGIGLVGGLRPGSPTFDQRNLYDASKRGPPPSLFKEPRRFLMQNEVYIGRMAMLGFAGACVLEYLWGGEAPLAHLGLITPGTSLAAAPWWTIFAVSLFLATGFGLLGVVGEPGRNNENF